MSKRIKITLIAVGIAILLAAAAIAMFVYYKSILPPGVRDNLPYGWGKEVSVILLAGQSNAAGCSRDDYLQMNVSPEKYAEYKKGYDNVYINYYVSGTNESGGFVKCAARQGEGEYAGHGFFGPELGLAERLHEAYPDRTFFIIKYAWGGTDLQGLWRAPSEGTDAGPLYQSFVEYVESSLRYLSLKNYKVKLEAMCWMQGEADSMSDEATADYEKNLRQFVNSLRTEFSDYTPADGMAFVDAYIAETIFWKNYAQINASKQALADSSHINAVINTVSCGLTVTEEPYDEPDIAHYDSLSELKLGYLFAEECSKFFDP